LERIRVWEDRLVLALCRLEVQSGSSELRALLSLVWGENLGE
jgi:hypothetical protein